MRCRAKACRLTPIHKNVEAVRANILPWNTSSSVAHLRMPPHDTRALAGTIVYILQKSVFELLTEAVSLRKVQVGKPSLPLIRTQATTFRRKTARLHGASQLG